MYSKSILKPGNARFLLFRLKRLCMWTAHLAFGLAANGRAPSVLVKVLDPPAPALPTPRRRATNCARPWRGGHRSGPYTYAGGVGTGENGRRPPAVRSTPSDAIRPARAHRAPLPLGTCVAVPAVAAGPSHPRRCGKSCSTGSTRNG